MDLSIPDDVWQASVQAAVDDWFERHPPQPPDGGVTPEPLGIEVTFPADYQATVEPVFGGDREPWWFGRGQGDDWTDPNGAAWESAEQPAERISGTLGNLRTDRLVVVHVRTATERIEEQVQVSGPTKPDGSQPAPISNSLEGLFAWDHGFGTTKSLLAKYGLAVPTPERPLICILHLDRSGDWAKAESAWFRGEWGPSGPAYRKAITIPPWPDGVSSDLAACARGDNDAHYRTMLRNCVDAFPGEILEWRWGHEANCCYNHKAVNDPASYKTAHDRFYDIAHEVAPDSIVVWCPIYGNGNISISAIEPTRMDKYAMDYYGSAHDYQSFVTDSNGLQFLADRAAAKGVGVGLYEFGPGEWGDPYQSQTMPDDPEWVHKLRAWQAECGADIVNYIDDTRSHRGVRSDFTVHPRCLEAWVATSTSAAAASSSTGRRRRKWRG